MDSERWDMSVPSRSSDRRWIKLPIQSGILCIIEPMRSNTRIFGSVSKIVFLTSKALHLAVKVLTLILCSFCTLGAIENSLPVTIAIRRNLVKDLVSKDCESPQKKFFT